MEPEPEARPKVSFPTYRMGKFDATKALQLAAQLDDERLLRQMYGSLPETGMAPPEEEQTS
ncbi:MAG TPA: hypothetical protein DIT48_09690 [Actinobacteria bacterium]|jgi:hypothetical protein|nr:hypothetical protein [Actinomycetota bacterium]HCP61508.1 hypothetical protein [Actinomycetota bacterium]